MKIFISPSNADVWVVAARLQALAAVYGFQCEIPPEHSRDGAPYTHSDFKTFGGFVAIVGSGALHPIFESELYHATRAAIPIATIGRRARMEFPADGKPLGAVELALFRKLVKVAYALLDLHHCASLMCNPDGSPLVPSRVSQKHP